VSIEEQYDEVRQLITSGKEKGDLLSDEINELLPSDITSSDEFDELFNTFGNTGIEIIDSDRSTCGTRNLSIATPKAPRGWSSTSRRGARQDQRSRPHVPARDGDRTAAHARG
jgi:hypothetical protein